MEFTTPTTKDEMYETLKEIYSFYRASLPIFREEPLEIMEIPSLEITEVTIEECRETAEQSLFASHTEKIKGKKANINLKISEIESEIKNLDEDEKVKIDECEKEYEKLIQKTKNEMVGKGLGVSCIAVNEVERLNLEKISAVGRVKIQYGVKKAELLSKVETLNAELDGVDEFYAEIHQSEIDAKANEIFSSRTQENEEKKKYNSSVYEKNLKYRNVILQARANLELKFMEVRKDYTTSELIEMGYYSDVLDCVMGYLKTLDDATAYQTVCDEYDLMQYLDHYYDSVVALYRQKNIIE